MNELKIELKSQEELSKIIGEQIVKIYYLQNQLQAYKAKEDKLREFLNKYEDFEYDDPDYRVKTQLFGELERDVLQILDKSNENENN